MVGTPSEGRPESSEHKCRARGQRDRRSGVAVQSEEHPPRAVPSSFACTEGVNQTGQLARHGSRKGPMKARGSTIGTLLPDHLGRLTGHWSL